MQMSENCLFISKPGIEWWVMCELPHSQKKTENFKDQWPQLNNFPYLIDTYVNYGNFKNIDYHF